MGFTDYGPHYLSVAATSSAPFVATLVDVTGLIIYFQVAAMVLRGVLV